ncbi:MAG: IS110 family transposase, partial [Roseiarcus sp.]
MPKPVDLSKSLAALDQDSTLIVVIELSQSSWLVAARAGLARDPLKKRAPDPEQLFKLIDRWREESRKAGRV